MSAYREEYDWDEIQKMMGRFREMGCIVQVWHIRDIQMLDGTLSDQQAMEILLKVEDRWDASIGINWDVLGEFVHDAKET